MSTLTNQTIKTVNDVMTFMKPFAGGSIPDADSTEYAEWLLWIASKQEWYATRGFWRRCLVKTSLTITAGAATTLLPANFHKPNGVYVLDVDGVDWAESNNSDGVRFFVEMENSTVSANLGKWQIRWVEAPSATVTASLWYFANPPKPTTGTDISQLPGDMVGYASLAEYFRVAGQDGSMDKAEQDAENCFNTYLSLEMIPPKYELLTFSTQTGTRVDRLAVAKSYYTSRPDRNSQV